jgi:hypothetical protein
MYLQGRRIAEHLKPSDHRRHGDQSHTGEDYGNYLAKQAQSYLAVIQAFSLIDSKNAWFTMPATQSTPFLRVSSPGSFCACGRQQADSFLYQAQKRRKVSSLIPSMEYSSRVKELEIVKSEDVRREYSAVVALLTVVRRVGGELDPGTWRSPAVTVLPMLKPQLQMHHYLLKIVSGISAGMVCTTRHFCRRLVMGAI